LIAFIPIVPNAARAFPVATMAIGAAGAANAGLNGGGQFLALNDPDWQQS